MTKKNVENIRAHVLSLIESEYESDAAFERSLNLKPKTVNNWRRGRSASFMKMLPTLSECFSVSVGELLDIPLSADAPELSEEELELLRLYRRARHLPASMRSALRETLEAAINLYISSANDAKNKNGTKRKNKE